MTFVTDALLVDGSVDRERFAELMCSSAASSRFVVDSFAGLIFEDKININCYFNLYISCGSLK